MTMYAYGSQRTHKRDGDSSRVARHAVDFLSHVCGAWDTACGREVSVYLGEWNPDDPNNCRGCTKSLAEESEGVPT